MKKKRATAVVGPRTGPPPPADPDRWTLLPKSPTFPLPAFTEAYYRILRDRSSLRVYVSREPYADGWRWHLSISHPDRYPTWDEIAGARYDLLPDGCTLAMLLPPRAQYVNAHPNVFHLHEINPGA